MSQRLMRDGYYVNASAFPAVPVGYGGIRFTQTLNHTPEQFVGLLDAIEFHLADLGTTPDVLIDLRQDAPELVRGI